MFTLRQQTDRITGTGTRHAKARSGAGLVAVVSALLLLLVTSTGGSAGVTAPGDSSQQGDWDWAQGVAYPRAIVDQAMATQGNMLYSFGGRDATTRFAEAYSFSPKTDSWTAIAPLPDVRSAAGAVSDGDYVYILGGADASAAPTTSLYRYHPATDSYITLAPFSVPTAAHAAVYLDGRIYRIAGCTTSACSGTGKTDTVEVYTIATDTWSLAAPLPQAVGWPAAMTDGRYIYVAGGALDGTTHVAKTYRYDPAANVWDDAAIADLPVGRSRAASGVLHNRWILAGGSTNSGYSTQSVESWNPETNEWSYLPPIFAPRTRAQGAVIKGGFSVIGGTFGSSAYTFSNWHQRYQDHTYPPPLPACNTQPPWQRGPYIGPDASFVPGVVGSDGYFYVGTGESAWTGRPVARGLLRFNAAANNWQVLAQPLVPTAAGAMGAPAAGRIYVAGGWIGGSPATTNTLQIYNIATDTWSLGASMPVSPGREGSAYASFGGKLYLFGGDTGVAPFQGTTGTYIYDPATDSWSLGAPLPEPRTWFSAAVAGNYIYTYGGYPASGVGNDRDTLWRYDPAADTWAVLNPSGHPITYAGFSGYTQGKLLAAGGMYRTGNPWVTTDTTWLYDIGTDTWSEGPRLNLIRGAMAQGLLPDGRVIVHGGYFNPGGVSTALGSTELLSPPTPCP
jgi:N-acetylneuraminic acid mutarotase